MPRWPWRRTCSTACTACRCASTLRRRTGEVTKIIERGTKSIDMMLYFLLFNIAPTVIELIAVGVIFYLNFGIELVLGTAVTVVL